MRLGWEYLECSFWKQQFFCKYHINGWYEASHNPAVLYSIRRLSGESYSQLVYLSFQFHEQDLYVPHPAHNSHAHDISLLCPGIECNMI